PVRLTVRCHDRSSDVPGRGGHRQRAEERPTGEVRALPGRHYRHDGPRQLSGTRCRSGGAICNNLMEFASKGNIVGANSCSRAPTDRYSWRKNAGDSRQSNLWASGDSHTYEETISALTSRPVSFGNN